jgi:Family of unknown function (DUF6365)
MRLLFLAPSRLSRGDAVLAAELARALPRSRFQVGFAAAPETLAHLHDLGMPALPLDGPAPGDNLGLLDRVVRGFKPDCLVAADPSAVDRSRDWTGLTIDTLRERYGRPVAGLDRLGWQAADYTADFYGGARVRLPRLLDACDAVIRTGPPHPAEPGPPGVAVAALRPGGLHEGGLRPSAAGPHEAARDGGRPTVFLVNSPWEYRNPTRSLPVAQLVDALPRIVHSHLAALGRPLEVVHVGPRRWRFPVAERIGYRHFAKLPYPMFHQWLAAADLLLTANVLSPTLAQAVLAGVPALVLEQAQRARAPEFADWVGPVAPLLRAAHPFRVAPLGWHDLLEPLLSGNPYRDCFATAGLLDRPAVLRALAGLLDDGPTRADLRRRQHGYRDRLAALPGIGDALYAAVPR